jgi:site-specific recombinase XerD
MSFLDEQEMDILLDYIREREKNEEMKLRNYIFVKLAYVSGMRLSEMLKIKVSDILDNSGFEITIIGK